MIHVTTLPCLFVCLSGIRDGMFYAWDLCGQETKIVFCFSDFVSRPPLYMNTKVFFCNVLQMMAGPDLIAFINTSELTCGDATAGSTSSLFVLKSLLMKRESFAN